MGICKAAQLRGGAGYWGWFGVGGVILLGLSSVRYVTGGSRRGRVFTTFFGRLGDFMRGGPI